MTVDTLLIFTGAFVAILPFLGFPQSWDKILFLLAGLLVVGLGIVVRRRGANHRVHSNQGEPFSESLPGQGAPARHEEELAQ